MKFKKYLMDFGHVDVHKAIERVEHAFVQSWAGNQDTDYVQLPTDVIDKIQSYMELRYQMEFHTKVDNHLGYNKYAVIDRAKMELIKINDSRTSVVKISKVEK